ncbi:MAG: glycosyltransferase [Flavobacteriales bacterium]|nr:glycosyltransferase [Flavobacteriales bacterium]
MELSVIIVNYNVRAYLEQCLRAVTDALQGVDGEVFVVDNQSTDGSVEMVRDRFPEVHVIANSVNVGFSRANNQAIAQAKGRYALLLNPDTIVGEDVFRKVIDFMDANPRSGGVGVKMIDGTGRFLPESKRGLPTPSVAFYKIMGLARLFPRSKIFGRYHLGHLSADRTAKIEILSGACMFLRRKTLDEVGLLDESFFMYGEDIDLSYRITLGGYENYYFPEAQILHYKGESTKKSSVNYVYVFYNAMAIFARKYFTRKRPDLFSVLITGSIYLSAAAAIVSRFLSRALLPIVDLSVLLIGSRLVWPVLGDPYTMEQWFLPTAGLVVIGVLALFGAYDRPVRPGNILRAGGALTLIACGSYLFAPMTGFGAARVFAMILIAVLGPLSIRLLLHLFRIPGYSLRDRHGRRVVAIGSEERSAKALALLWQTHFGLGRQKVLSPDMLETGPSRAEVSRMIRNERIDEVVFCASDMSWRSIISAMQAIGRSDTIFKIAQPDDTVIIGTNSIESINDLFILDVYSMNIPAARRTKRSVDILVSVVLMATLPVNIWFVHDQGQYLGNLLRVLKGELTWVGLSRYHLPMGAIRSRPGVLRFAQAMGARDERVARRMELIYAKDYRATNDLDAILRGFSRLGS